MPSVPRGLGKAGEARQNAQRKVEDALGRKIAGVVERAWGRDVRRGKKGAKNLRALPDELEGILEFELRKAARTSYRGWRRAVAKSTPATRDAPPASQEVIDRMVERSLKGKTWRKRLGEHGKRAMAALRAAKTPEERAAAIGKLRAQAAALARTEAARLNQQARDRAVQDHAGDRLAGWKYQTMEDSRVRPLHARRHGKVYKKGQKRIALPDGPNCRCWYVPVLKAVRRGRRG